MRRLEGSKTCTIECRDCGIQSPTFRAYLYAEYSDQFDSNPEHFWDSKSTPQGWEILDEEGLEVEHNFIWGYCPDHAGVKAHPVL